MQHRIFLAINLPEEIKNKLAKYQASWPELPIKWTKKDNLHITLVFIGRVKDEEIPEICKISEKVAEQNKSFTINLNKICYAPPKKMPPRMVWAAGETSNELTKLQRELEDSLLTSTVKRVIKEEKRAYFPHITLGRIRTWEFRRIEPGERPAVNEDISLSFEVNSIEVMESQLKRSGAEYTILSSYDLKYET